MSAFGLYPQATYFRAQYLTINRFSGLYAMPTSANSFKVNERLSSLQTVALFLTCLLALFTTAIAITNLLTWLRPHKSFQPNFSNDTSYSSFCCVLQSPFFRAVATVLLAIVSKYSVNTTTQKETISGIQSLTLCCRRVDFFLTQFGNVPTRNVPPIVNWKKSKFLPAKQFSFSGTEH